MIGEGITIAKGVTITFYVRLEGNVHVHLHAVIGHDIHIGKHSMVGADAEIGGTDKILERIFIGYMADTLHGLTTGNNVELAADSIVLRNIEPGMIVIGNPARVIRRNEGRCVFTKPTANQ